MQCIISTSSKLNGIRKTTSFNDLEREDIETFRLGCSGAVNQHEYFESLSILLIFSLHGSKIHLIEGTI